MHLKLRSYKEQSAEWPKSGRHILAQYDADSIIVYQAYRPEIAEYAVHHQRFGGEFSFNRMSWIKPNFLWMMYRSGWAGKPGQERVLAVRLPRSYFDYLLATCVASTQDEKHFPSHQEWKAALGKSEVRLQWDPDHHPRGAALERRALQLGLRGEALRQYATAALINVQDITEFVNEQASNAKHDLEKLLVPEEHVYRPEDPRAAEAVGLSE